MEMKTVIEVEGEACVYKLNLKDNSSPGLFVQKAEGSTGMDSMEAISLKSTTQLA